MKDVLTLNISKGHARFAIAKVDGKMAVLVLRSDVECKELGVHDRKVVSDEESLTPVLAVPLEDYRQAEAYSAIFGKLARRMKENEASQ